MSRHAAGALFLDMTISLLPYSDLVFFILFARAFCWLCTCVVRCSCFLVVSPRISCVTAVHRDQHREPEPERRQAQQDKVVISQEVSKISRRHSFADGFVQARWLCEEQIHPFVQRRPASIRSSASSRHLVAWHATSGGAEADAVFGVWVHCRTASARQQV